MISFSLQLLYNNWRRKMKCNFCGQARRLSYVFWGQGRCRYWVFCGHFCASFADSWQHRLSRRFGLGGSAAFSLNHRRTNQMCDPQSLRNIPAVSQPVQRCGYHLWRLTTHLEKIRLVSVNCAGTLQYFQTLLRSRKPADRKFYRSQIGLTPHDSHTGTFQPVTCR